MTEGPGWDAVVVHPEDDVATALHALSAGSVARVQVGAATRECMVAEPIPAGHKLALRELEAGAPVTKYGEPIGETTTRIGRGAWVHTHNLRSRRAQRSAGS